MIQQYGRIRFHYFLGIPLVITSTISAALIYSDLPTENKWFTSSASLAAVILASLQTFLSFNEKAAMHRNAAYKYRDLKEELELAILHPPAEENIDKWLSDMKDMRSNISSISPSCYSWSWKTAKKETETENEENSVRN